MSLSKPTQATTQKSRNCRAPTPPHTPSRGLKAKTWKGKESPQGGKDHLAQMVNYLNRVWERALSPGPSSWRPERKAVGIRAVGRACGPREFSIRNFYSIRPV